MAVPQVRGRSRPAAPANSRACQRRSTPSASRAVTGPPGCVVMVITALPHRTKRQRINHRVPRGSRECQRRDLPAQEGGTERQRRRRYGGRSCYEKVTPYGDRATGELQAEDGDARDVAPLEDKAEGRDFGDDLIG